MHILDKTIFKVIFLEYIHIHIHTHAHIYSDIPFDAVNSIEGHGTDLIKHKYLFITVNEELLSTERVM